MKNLGLFASAFFALGLASCGKEPDHAEPEPSPPPIPELYRAAAELTAAEFVDGARIVSRGDPTKKPGDGLTFAGVWLYAAPCDLSAPLGDALAGEIVARGGIISRHPSLADEVTLDGALALYRGVAEQVRRCGKADTWREAIRLHRDYVNAHAGRMNPGSDSTLLPPFDYPLERIAAGLGLAPMPSAIDLRALEIAVGTWAHAVVTTHSACFRIHLGYLALTAPEALGDDVHRATFCAGAVGADIPLIDHYCGRGDLKAWVAGYERDLWEYRHQRCGGWETPDGKGIRHPGVDLQAGIREAYLVPDAELARMAEGF